MKWDGFCQVPGSEPCWGFMKRARQTWFESCFSIYLLCNLGVSHFPCLSLNSLAVKVRHSDYKVCSGVPGTIPFIWFLWVANISPFHYEHKRLCIFPAPSPAGELIIFSEQHQTRQCPSLKQIHLPLGLRAWVQQWGAEGANISLLPGSLLSQCPGKKMHENLQTQQCMRQDPSSQDRAWWPSWGSDPTAFSCNILFSNSHTQTHKNTYNTTFVSRAFDWVKNVTYMAWQKMAERSSFF